MTNIIKALFLKIGITVFSLLTLFPAAASAQITPFAVGPLSWQQGIVNQVFSLQLQTTAGVAPMTWTITSGTLPDGVTLDSASGLISGTPTIAGSYPITAQVEDANGATASKDFALAVYPSVGGFSYSRTPSGSTVSNPVTIHLRGVFGADFCSNAATGFHVDLGFFPFPIYHVTNQGATSGNVIDQDYTFTLPFGEYQRVILYCHEPQGFTEMRLENGTTEVVPNQPPILDVIGNKSTDVGQVLQFTVNATDPDANDIVILSASNLPIGAAFDSQTGVFSWTPTSSDVGLHQNIQFTAIDEGNLSDSEVILIEVNPLPTITTIALPEGTLTMAYSQFLGVSGGTGPMNWSVTVGSLPAGLSLGAATGEISGTPTANGTVTFTVQVTDSLGASASQVLSLRINKMIVITTSHLPDGKVGSSYSKTFHATGGADPLIWTLVGGSLPASLSLSATGVLSGTPTTVGDYSFTIQVQDANGSTDTHLIVLTIKP